MEIIQTQNLINAYNNIKYKLLYIILLYVTVIRAVGG